MTEGDGPLAEVFERANELIEAGGMVLQKFTCSGCGKRLTMDVPNVFYIEGSCDTCNAVTNIQEQGCGFTLIMGDPEMLARAMNKEMNDGDT